MKSKATKNHNAKKSPGMREKFERERKARNAERPKQRWTGGESVKEGGHWERP